MSKLKISLVGLGQRGMVHLKSLGRLSDEDFIEIAAIADPFEENLCDRTKTDNIATKIGLKPITKEASEAAVLCMPYI